MRIMEIKCPKCGDALLQKTYETVPIWNCALGHGNWIMGNDLAEIAKIRGKRFPESSMKGNVFLQSHKISCGDEQKISCPLCGGICEKVNYSYSSGIFIDHCPNGCGIWLDDGELQKIQAFSEFWDTETFKVITRPDVDARLKAIETQYDSEPEGGSFAQIIYWICNIFGKD